MKKLKSKFNIVSFTMPSQKIILAVLIALVGIAGYLVFFATRTVSIESISEEGLTEYTKIKVPLFQRTEPLTAEAAPNAWSVAVVAPSNSFERDIKTKLDSVSSEFNRISGGKFRVSYQIFYTNDQTVCNNDELNASLKQQIGFSSKNTIIYWMPARCAPDAIGQPVGTEDSNANGGIWSATVYTASVATSSILHEIGHYALTLPHAEDYCVNGQSSANRYTCAKPATANAKVGSFSVQQLQTNLRPLVKGDGLDYMGNCATMGSCNFNAAFRAKIGWISNVRTLPATNNTALTLNMVSASAQSGNSPQLVNVFDYHLELNNNRLDIRKKCSSSRAVYNSPSETTCYVVSLSQGQIFYDSGRKLWIKLISSSNNSGSIFVGVDKNPSSSSTPDPGIGGTPVGGTQNPSNPTNPTTPVPPINQPSNPTPITTSLLGKPSIPANSPYSPGPITVKKNISVTLTWVCANSDRAKLLNESLTQVGTTGVTGTFITKAFNNTGNKTYQLTCYKNNKKVSSKSLTIKITN